MCAAVAKRRRIGRGRAGRAGAGRGKLRLVGRLNGGEAVPVAVCAAMQCAGLYHWALCYFRRALGQWSALFSGMRCGCGRTAKG